MTAPAPPPPVFSAAVGLRAGLDNLDYAAGPLRERLALRDEQAFPPVGHAPSVVRLMRGRADACALLARLLLLGQDVPLTDLVALPASVLSALQVSGVVRPCGAVLRPLVRVTPFHDLLVAGDLHDEPSPRTAHDAVENPHGPTAVLARLVPRDRVNRSLDIGTGTGVHALLLARHSRAVLGVDISPRAIEFARFNAALNGVRNVEFRQGDVTDGLPPGEPFDLIVSNPPYLLSPESAYVYRDGPPGSAHVASRVLRDAAALLTRGGLSISLTSWSAGTNDIAQPLESIIEPTGCHALVFVFATRAVLDDALRWNAHSSSTSKLDEDVGRWLRYSADRGVSEVAYGAAILTRADGDAWFRSERVALAGQSLDGGQLRDIVAASHAIQRGAVPVQLRLHPSHEIESVAKVVEGRFMTREQFLYSTRGIRFSVSCGPRLLDAVAAGDAIPTGAVRRMAHRLYGLGMVVGVDDGSN